MWEVGIRWKTDWKENSIFSNVFPKKRAWNQSESIFLQNAMIVASETHVFFLHKCA